MCRRKREKKVKEKKTERRGGSLRGSHPSRHDGVDISGVAVGQGHEVGVERPDSLEHQPDVAGRGEVQQGRGGVVRTGPAIDQRGVDLSGDEKTDGGKEGGDEQRQAAAANQVKTNFKRRLFVGSGGGRWLEGVRVSLLAQAKQMTNANRLLFFLPS